MPSPWPIYDPGRKSRARPQSFKATQSTPQFSNILRLSSKPVFAHHLGTGLRHLEDSFHKNPSSSRNNGGQVVPFSARKTGRSSSPYLQKDFLSSRPLERRRFCQGIGNRRCDVIGWRNLLEGWGSRHSLRSQGVLDMRVKRIEGKCKRITYHRVVHLNSILLFCRFTPALVSMGDQYEAGSVTKILQS